jgi:quercetin dioxygenase-like cupin family protein
MTLQDRRTFLGIAAALLPIGLDAQTAAQTPATPGAASSGSRGELARHALTGPFEGFEMVVTHVTARPGPSAQPGSANPGHRHPGPVLGYVLEGQLRFAINNEPERIVPAGSTFFEPIGALHSTGGGTSDGPAHFLAFLIVPKGSPIVMPA